jgi:hypothetical protein
MTSPAPHDLDRLLAAWAHARRLPDADTERHWRNPRPWSRTSGSSSARCARGGGQLCFVTVSSSAGMSVTRVVPYPSVSGCPCSPRVRANSSSGERTSRCRPAIAK